MIRSMTGYGRCEKEENGHKINLEISSVNHRYCDITIRLPRALNPLEDKIRKCIKNTIGRGKVEVSLFYTSLNEEDVDVVVNEAVCTAYVHKLREVGQKLQLQDNLGLAEIMALNDLISIQKKSIDSDAVWSILEGAVEEALRQLVTMREVEGEVLKKDLLGKADWVRSVAVKLEEVNPLVVAHYKTRLEERIAKLLEQQIDETRLAMEVALFADRCAIDEELTRLKSHVAQLESILEAGGQVGRKLDFLMQEMNREANTIASKANDYSVTEYAVQLKTEIEKMREQIQNLE